jgi:hypothetical protein
MSIFGATPSVPTATADLAAFTTAVPGLARKGFVVARASSYHVPMSARRGFILLLLVAVTGCSDREPPAPDTLPPDTAPVTAATGQFVPLFNGGDLATWRSVVDGADANFTPAFEVRQGMILVTGKPTGYLATRASYRNFVLRYDWKFSDRAGGNSGLLVFVQRTSHQGSWPPCIEVQGKQSEHGAIFPIAGGTGTFRTDQAAIAKAVRPGEWNTTEVVSRDGELTSSVNGVRVSSGRTDLGAGPLAWQSEGAELYLRNLQIKVT